MLADWIISYMPSHRVYVEPYGGGAAVLLRKGRVHEEIYNDLDGDVVNLFRVVRDNGHELVSLIELTPYSREEYMQSYVETDDPLERARRTIIRAFMGRGSNGATGRLSKTGALATGFKGKTRGAGKTAAKVWADYPESLVKVIERLHGVVIENKDALEIIESHDCKDALFYVDPPYVLSTRDSGKDYRHEMTDDDHIALYEKLNLVEGMVIISGNQSELYERLHKGWTRIEKSFHADGMLPRIEVLWMKNIEMGLFGGDFQ
jgi:DNA adenine methylase